MMLVVNINKGKTRFFENKGVVMTFFIIRYLNVKL